MNKQDTAHCACLIHNGRLISPFEEVSQGWILVDDGKIKEVGKGKKPEEKTLGQTNIKMIDAEGNFVIPGLIDTHVCGMMGHDCREGTRAYRPIAQGLLKFGITGFLPTLLSTPTNVAMKLVDQIKEAQATDAVGAKILGVHLEGPYLGRKYRGLTLGEELAEPSTARDRPLYQQFPNFIKIVTLTPELPGCLPYITYLKEQGVVVAISHTEIKTMAELNRAIEAGASHVSHIFNAMQTRGLKELGVDSPGFADLALISDRLTVSFVADGVHVCKELINLLIRAKPHDKIVLITDSFMGTGMPDGTYTYPDGIHVFVDGTCHRRVDDKTIAGSTLTLNRAVKNMIDWTGLPLTEVLPMATYNPARLIGLDEKKGSLKAGMDADLVVVDEEWNARCTILNGQIVYKRKEKDN